MNCKMRQSVLSTSLLVTQNWEEHLTHQRVVVPSRVTLIGWENGLAGTSKNSMRRSAKSFMWETVTQGPVNIGDHPVGKQHNRKGHGVQCWAPSTRESETLERVQRRSTKMTKEIKPCLEQAMLSKLQLISSSQWLPQ